MRVDHSRERRGAVLRGVAGRGALTLALLVGAAACTDDDSATSTTRAAAASTSTTTPARPDGPVADLSEALEGDGRPFMGAATGVEVPDGFVEEELVAAGTATSYRAVGELGEDGHWTFEEDATADYRTRVVVRRPADPEDASGTVIVEWLNVSGGLDANPDYASLEEEIVRQGHTWVGVSAQLIGVAGGPVLVKAPGAEAFVGKGLVGVNPDRYGTLDHPGDGYAFDIFTQVARAARAGAPFVGGIEPEIVLAAGESQSALALTTYYDGVQPLTGMFDGFLIHSRASVGLPLVGDGEYADLAGSIVEAKPALLRDDLSAPAIVVQAESDVIGVLNSVEVRQADSPTLRFWEVAGTAHADKHLLGEIADLIDCGVPINDGPLHYVVKAALRSLEAWVREGTEPPGAPFLDLAEGDEPAIARDEDGIALGGIRTPPVDVPVVVLSGVAGPNPDLLCILLGSTSELPEDRLAARYDSAADYEAQYAAAVDEVIDAGFVLEEDRAALLADADPSKLPG